MFALLTSRTENPLSRLNFSLILLFMGGPQAILAQQLYMQPIDRASTTHGAELGALNEIGFVVMLVTVLAAALALKARSAELFIVLLIFCCTVLVLYQYRLTAPDEWLLAYAGPLLSFIGIAVLRFGPLMRQIAAPVQKVLPRADRINPRSS